LQLRGHGGAARGAAGKGAAGAHALAGLIDLRAPADGRCEHFRGDLPEEAAGHAEHLRAHDAAAAGGAEGEAELGAGDGHVEEAALLLQTIRRLAGIAVGEDVLFHAHHKDVGELQPLGAVDGHEAELGGFLQLVRVRGQGDAVQELREAQPQGLGFSGGAEEFLQVANAALGLQGGLVLQAL
jgi:hypothetical protein